MVIFFSLLTFLLLTPAVFAQDCYLFISADRKFDKSALDQQIRPLITNYLSVEIKDVGIAGLSIDNEQLQKECQYHVGLTESSGQYSVSVNSRNTPFPLNSVIETKRQMPLGMKVAILRILYKELDSAAQNDLCFKYRHQLIDECPQFPRTFLVYEKSPDEDFEKYSKEAKALIRNELEVLVSELERIQFQKADIYIERSSPDQLQAIFDQKQAQILILFSLEGEMLKKQTTLWAGFADLSMTMSAYRIGGGDMVKLGEFNTEMVRMPIEEWKKSSRFKRERYAEAAEKLTTKWDEVDILEFLEKITN